jgi:two-component sensor histidine kinase
MLSDSTRKALTGRWAISRTPYLVIAPTAVASVVLIEATSFHANEIGGWLLASAGGYIVFCALLYISHLTIFRNRATKPVPVAWIFIVGFVFGAIKGFTTGTLSVLLDLEPDVAQGISVRFFGAGFLGLVGVPASAIVMNTLEEFREKRAELIAEQIRLESKELQSQEVIAAMSAQLRSSIESDLSVQLDVLKRSLEETSAPSDSWQLLADDLRVSARETVRDMSHRLWERPSSSVRDITLVDICKAMITTSAFPLKLILPFLLVSAIAVNLNDHGSSELPSRLLMLAFTTSLIYLSGTSAIERWIKYKYQIYVSTLFLAALAPSLYSLFTFGDTFDQHFLGVNVTIAIWIPLLTITCGLIDTSFKQRQEILDDLQDRIDKSRIRTISEENETIRLSSDMAKYLHGNLQSRLMASAFAIEMAGNAQDSTALLAEIEKARQSVTTPFDQLTSREMVSIANELSNLIGMWDGILTTQVEFTSSEKDVSIIDARNIVHVVEEAFSNALRHGLATEATIVLNSNATEISLTVIDNGIGPRAGDPGLGSSLFNSIAGSNWSLSRGPEGVGAALNLKIAK